MQSVQPPTVKTVYKLPIQTTGISTTACRVYNLPQVRQYVNFHHYHSMQSVQLPTVKRVYKLPIQHTRISTTVCRVYNLSQLKHIVYITFSNTPPPPPPPPPNQTTLHTLPQVNYADYLEHYLPHSTTYKFFNVMTFILSTGGIRCRT